MTLTALAIALAAATPASDSAQSNFASNDQAEQLGAVSLANGNELRAIRALEKQLEANPDDPALLINLGIAHATLGDEDKARQLFKAAMESRERIELETADGYAMDSRRLARKAIGMLDRGEFRPANQLTLRD